MIFLVRSSLCNPKNIFGLTKAEAQVAALIGQGSTVNETAKLLFVSVKTVRTHLKRALGKTGTKRQQELVSLSARLNSQPGTSKVK